LALRDEFSVRAYSPAATPLERHGCRIRCKLTAYYPSAAKTAATAPPPATNAPPSADTLDFDRFGLNGLHPVTSGKCDGFSPCDRKEKSGGRKGYCKFQLHLIIPEVGKIFTINEIILITNVKVAGHTASVDSSLPPRNRRGDCQLEGRLSAEVV